MIQGHHNFSSTKTIFCSCPSMDMACCFSASLPFLASLQPLQSPSQAKGLPIKISDIRVPCAIQSTSDSRIALHAVAQPQT